MSEHYDPDIKAMKDYEALNADTALQLNKAKKEIERLQFEIKTMGELAERSIDAENEEIERLRAALEQIEGLAESEYIASIAREALREVGDE